MGKGESVAYTQYQAISKNPPDRIRKSVMEQHNVHNGHGHHNGFTYEHFPVVCPTCEGKGEICEDDGGMVTFVPVKDDRLKPAWTKSKISLMIMFTLIAGGASTYFLYPRSVFIHVAAHSILSFDFKKGQQPWIQYSFDVSVKNNNFFSITVKEISMNLLYRQQSVCKLTNAATVHAVMRSEKMVIVKMNVSYDTPSDKYITRQCYQERDYIGQLMQSSGELSYWIHSEHLESQDDYFYTDCDSFVFPEDISTTAATTTATTTTTTTTTTIEEKTTHNVITMPTKTTKEEKTTHTPLFSNGIKPTANSSITRETSTVTVKKQPETTKRTLQKSSTNAKNMDGKEVIKMVTPKKIH